MSVIEASDAVIKPESDDDGVSPSIGQADGHDSPHRQDSDLSEFSIARLKIVPSPENDDLYGPINPDDQDIVDLADSISSYGLQERIVITLDGYILSGHRRYVACELAGLDDIPVRVEPLRRSDYDKSGYLKLLREFNRQRVKTRDQRLREEVLDINTDEAYEALLEHRRSSAVVRPRAMYISGYKHRCEISEAKAPLMEAIQGILADRRRFWPLSDRVIHYALLNDPPPLHAKRPTTRYANTLNCYKGLCDLLTRARVAGLIDWEAIADETRPVTTWAVWRETGAFVGDALNNFLKGYWRDLQQSQPNHIEILVEKNTVAGIVKEVAMRYCIPITSGRGYCSITPRKEMVDRFEASGKDKLILLMVSDFDPDGEEIAESCARSIRDDFGIDDIHPIKVALTGEQVKRFNLPPTMQAKLPKSKAQAAKRLKFVKDQGGDNVFEVEALHPAGLQAIVTEAIDSVIDIDAFNAELAAEKQDAAFLAVVRETVKNALKGIDLTGTGNK
jgi:hypothetical protein